jgi:predicted unusual protein kinase regulating ubiquinone biosynthesis (AarF/ABC1/UbiB family)
MGVLLPGADLELLERAEATVFDRYWGKSMSELTHVDPHEVSELMAEFRELVFNMPFQVPQNLIFLARAVAILSGMCTGLDREFNVWDHLAPYARKLIAQEARPASEAILNEAANLFRSVIAIPRKMDVMLTRMERGEIAVRAPEVSRQIRHMEHAIRQVAGGVIFAALLLGGIQLHLANDPIFSDILLAGAGVSLIWTILSGRRF